MPVSRELDAPISTSASDGRRLNAADRVMLAVDQALRHIGYPGFQTQAFLCLGGRVDERELRAGLIRLSECHPVTVARLVEKRGGPYWQLRQGARLSLDVIELPSDSDAALHQQAGRLLGVTHDPAAEDPVRFHLLRRPDGRDVLLLQYSHALMDNNATPLLLAELARCSSSSFGTPLPAEANGLAVMDRSGSPLTSTGEGLGVTGKSARDPLWGYVRRHPRRRRRAAVDAARQRLIATLVYRGTMLGRPTSRPSASPFGILSRQLAPAEARALSLRTRQSCGLPSLSMSILASVFRAIDRLAPPGGRDNFAAGIGIDLGLRGPAGPIFQNLMSLVTVRARPDELADKTGLIRSLNRQMREALASDADLGMAALIGLFARRLHRAIWIAEACLRYSFSLWYAYFGAIDMPDEFFGIPVEDAYYAGPCWSPMGVTLLVNQFRGRLRFQATYVPESVPEPLANAFLDEVLGDLTRG